MKTIYAIRHRVAGIITSHVYANPPTEAQLAERKQHADAVHGIAGAKSLADNWVAVEEIKLIEGDELDPYVPPEPSKPLIPGMKFEASGHVGPASDVEHMTIGADDIGTITVGEDGEPKV